MKRIAVTLIGVAINILPLSWANASDLPEAPEWMFSIEQSETFAGSAMRIDAAVLAATTTSDLRWAAFEITCDTHSLAPPDIGVSYIYSGDTMNEMEEIFPFFNYADAYSLDLIDSANSGRPAAYNLGNGFVRNDDYSGWSREHPEAYYQRTAAFIDEFVALKDTDTIQIRFVNTRRHSERMNGSYFEMIFPMTSVSSNIVALHECLYIWRNRSNSDNQ